MDLAQPGILATDTTLARYLTFSIHAEDSIHAALKALVEHIDPDRTIVGLGQSLVNALGKEVPGLRTFQAQTGQGIDIPSTPSALWCWLRGNDRGELFHRSRKIESLLMPGFALEDAVDSFLHDNSRDLSGYEDGTENPKNSDAINAAIVQNQGSGLDGSSFVTVLQWLHDFDALDDMTTAEKDNTVGRHISDNEEFDAPKSAHVKRTAQESFEPEAFILRRSLPWAEGMDAGLYFVAFGKSFDAFEALIKRMLGNEDGIVDAIFNFTRPLNGAYFWCPPVKNGKLNLSLLDI